MNYLLPGVAGDEDRALSKLPSGKGELMALVHQSPIYGGAASDSRGGLDNLQPDSRCLLPICRCPMHVSPRIVWEGRF